MKFKTRKAAVRHKNGHTKAEAARLYVTRANYFDVKKDGWRRCWTVKRRPWKEGAPA